MLTETNSGARRMLIDFLKAEHTEDELTAALKVLKSFKSCESPEEHIRIPFACWNALEWLEEYLEHRVNGTELSDATKAELERLKSDDKE